VFGAGGPWQQHNWTAICTYEAVSFQANQVDSGSNWWPCWTSEDLQASGHQYIIR